MKEKLWNVVDIDTKEVLYKNLTFDDACYEQDMYGLSTGGYGAGLVESEL